MTDLLLTEDELLLRRTVRDFADKVLIPKAADYDQRGEFPRDNVRGLADLGLYGLTVDEQYGGSGGNFAQLAIASEEVARGCASTSVIWLAHHSLGTKFIENFGSEEQKSEYVPPLASAEKIAAFGLTEPGAGSDAAGIQTRATRSNGRYLLNGSKTFITNAVEADVFVVMATIDPALRAKGITGFIVPRDAKGFTVTPLKGKMGIRASSTAELHFEDTPVPIENRIGGEGEGFSMIMELLDASRIGIGAQAVGIAQGALEAAISYAKQRQAFGKRLADMQALQFTLADMATQVDAARLLVRRAAQLFDSGNPFVAEAAMAKLYASRAAVEVADRALQLHGGSGYFAPATVERLYRDAKVTEIYEGTSEIQRLIIARNLLV
ncbi:MAG: acyl-CoA dehydrogenase family protein [Chloroflexi bacterium]|nr:acyl-CoA dehydrogenase family protein [Chloroflexota bacterium]